MAKIVTVYRPTRTLRLDDMALIRWWRISESLARLGHDVDIATNQWRWIFSKRPKKLAPNLRIVPLNQVRWNEYDVVKTGHHLGYETLCRHGGQQHPFIISNLGSVVGPVEMPGIFFYGATRQRLFATQQMMARSGHYVSVISSAARELWRDCFGSANEVLKLPGAADARISAPGPDPYPDRAPVRCIFSGNIYNQQSQPEANTVLVDKLNRLGRLLRNRGIQLYLLGIGDVSGLDRKAVVYLGSCTHDQSWDYLHHAQVGVSVTGGGVMHNNESTKLYQYLRAGLPVVSEAGFPNDYLVRESGLGELVEIDDIEDMAEKVHQASTRAWDRDAAIQYILDNHTWDVRAAVYDQLICERLGSHAGWQA